jgi:hypothetical protein
LRSQGEPLLILFLPTAHNLRSISLRLTALFNGGGQSCAMNQDSQTDQNVNKQPPPKSEP